MARLNGVCSLALVGMDRGYFPCIFTVAGLGLAAILSGCGTTHRLPPFERPLARTEYQTVRTTAYTHTESDHLEYGNHNALGGTLHAASAPVLIAAAPRAVLELAPATIVNEEGGFHRAPPNPGRAVLYAPAAPVFRIESTGQIYRVDDYGWALAGRNTIDLYKASTRAMNEWGVRREGIQVLSWGDRSESLRMLRNHQKYRHIRRMVLELEGREHAAANLE